MTKKQAQAFDMSIPEIEEQIQLAKDEMASAMRRRRMYESLLRTIRKIEKSNSQDK